MRAIVLSGGGACGSYQIGVWKALRKLNINYDIVTGTSVGALNGALMVQNDYVKALLLWYNISYNDVFKISDKYSKNEIMKFYKDNILKGGVDVSNLEKTIKKYVRPTKFFSSNIDYGLITVKFPSLKHVEMTKKKLTRENLDDYLVASASCFPAFKVKKIGKESYIDGGFYDNLPINLAIKLGATEVIAVDLDEIGIKRNLKYDAKVKYITPRNDIGSFLKFDKQSARRGIKYGYNDTMKSYKMLDGNKYTFKYGDLSKNANKYSEKFIKKIEEIIKSDLIEKVIKFKLNENSVKNKINKIIEDLGYLCHMDDTRIYSIDYFNKTLKTKVSMINSSMDKFKKYINDLDMVKYLHKNLNNSSIIDKYSILYTNELMMAVYLEII